MKYIGAIMLLISLGAATCRADEGQTVKLFCENRPQSLDAKSHAALCTGVAERLAKVFPGIRVADTGSGMPAGPLIKLEVIAADAHSVSGRLAWRDAGGDFQAGPVVTTTIIDSTLNERAIQDFAKGLVLVSKISFSNE